MDDDQLKRTTYLARQSDQTRTAYIRQAIREYNTKIERELLSSNFREASKKCQEANLKVGREMEVADSEIDE